MAPEEAQPNAPRRRGRPPGSKTTGTGRKLTGGGDLVAQLNSMVAELIKKNRLLQRQVTKLTERAGKSSTSKGVERGLRTISRRVQRALGSTKRRGKKGPEKSPGRKNPAREGRGPSTLPGSPSFGMRYDCPT